MVTVCGQMKYGNSVCGQMKYGNSVCVQMNYGNSVCVQMKYGNSVCVQMKYGNCVCVQLKYGKCVCVQMKYGNSVCVQMKYGKYAVSVCWFRLTPLVFCFSFQADDGSRMLGFCRGSVRFCPVLLVLMLESCGANVVIQRDAQFDVTYDDTVTSDNQTIYSYNHTVSWNKARVHHNTDH